jgi:hypothetical protein
MPPKTRASKRKEDAASGDAAEAVPKQVPGVCWVGVSGAAGCVLGGSGGKVGGFKIFLSTAQILAENRVPHVIPPTVPRRLSRLWGAA